MEHRNRRARAIAVAKTDDTARQQWIAATTAAVITLVAATAILSLI